MRQPQFEETANEVTGNIPPTARPLLLGHRGARANKSIPENTLASFDQAMADGCDGFEFDLRKTADGKAVICHDPKIETRVGSQEIATAQASAMAGLPCLEQVLERYSRTAFLDIEVKVAGLEKHVCEWLQKCKFRRGFVVSSFLPEVLRDFRIRDSHVPLGLICETSAQLEPWRDIPVDYVIVHHSLAATRLIHEIQRAQKKIFVWTVNQRTVAKKFAELGVDGIISDDTRMLGRMFETRDR